MAGGQPVGTVVAAAANLRGGPGTGYDVVGQATQGTMLTILARNQAGEWLQACCVNNSVGWIWHQLVVVEGSLDSLPVLQEPGAPAQPEPQPQAPWRGEFFANRELQGAPVHVSQAENLHFEWGGNAPAQGVPAANWSARWTGRFDFAAGDYVFNAEVDDGVRLWLDGILLIDRWRIGSRTRFDNTFRELGAGPHTVTVEYFQGEGASNLRVWWEQIGAAGGFQSQPPSQFLEWKGEYFNDIHLQGEPLLVRNDLQLNFDWHLDSPDPRVPADNWSARWTRQVHFEAGSYNFFAYARDAVRVFLDGWKVIDEWHDAEGNPTYTGRFDHVGAGNHTVVVEYYARGGLAYARVWWERA